MEEHFTVTIHPQLRAQLDLLLLKRCLRDHKHLQNFPPLLPALERCIYNSRASFDAVLQSLVTTACKTPSLILAPRALAALCHALRSSSPYADSAKLADLQLSCLGGRDFFPCNPEAYDVASMRCVELCVQTAQIPKESGQSAPAPPPPGGWATARAPARVDLAGGWTDTPPICYEVGGRVVNLAITVNGRKPIGARARRLPGRPVIIIATRDNDPARDNGDKPPPGLTSPRSPLSRRPSSAPTSRVVVTLAADLDCSDPTAAGSLAKAVLQVIGGLSPSAEKGSLTEQLQGDGGFEIETWSELPHGSGLGTSSILAGAVCAAVGALLRRTLGPTALAHAVLQVEQRLTTGGGWQDQLGGLIGGAKLCSCNASLPLEVQCESLPLKPSAQRLLSEHLQLIFTGQVRLAKNLLRDVLNRWLLGKPKSVNNIANLVSTADAMAKAIREADIPSIGVRLADYWRQKKNMCDAGPPAVTSMIGRLHEKDLIHGAELTGAGGGGFLLVVTKKPRARASLEAALEGMGVEFYDLAVDGEGLAVAIDGEVASEDEV